MSSSNYQPVFFMYADHPRGDSISAVATTADNEHLLTGDTSGQLKLWNFCDFRFREDHDSDKIHVEWFIMAHKSVINSIQLCEAFEADTYIISASQDHNIHLHKLSNGAFIGQFGNEPQWNIHDLTAFDRR